MSTNTKFSNEFIAFTNRVKEFYYDTIENLKFLEKIDKKLSKKLKKESIQILENLNYPKKKFFTSKNNSLLPIIFIFEVLGINIITFPMFEINYTTLPELDINILKRDKNFSRFLTQIIMIDLMFRKSKTDDVDEDLEFVQTAFGDLRATLLCYFILQENNITQSKLQNITSYVCKGLKMDCETALNQTQKIVLNQILTGVSEERLKPVSISKEKTRPYNEKETIDILEIANNSIKIKYISKKYGKHKSHQSPEPHIREEHWRHYKNGRKVLIRKTIINEKGRV